MIFYRVIVLVQGTSSVQIMLGGIFLVTIYFLADYFHLIALYYTLDLFFSSLVVILVVLFSNDLRRGLASFNFIGFKWRNISLADPYFFDRLYQACEYFTTHKIGSLIVLEKKHSLKHYAHSGTILNARISSPLLVSIFNKDSPLHDGAILINRKLSLYAAACILPLTARINLNIKMGTRHRSAIGISEETDCLAVVVSEENGCISFFENGKQELIELCDFKEKLKKRLLSP
ncbi:MAG: diadenylate cyclase [SAR324 cluster bacterium]|nr:diadenylate cyclase [SAR324 cluster bacterium]